MVVIDCESANPAISASMTLNGSADGTLSALGFQARFILLRRAAKAAELITLLLALKAQTTPILSGG
jgi:hypothetical protein